MTVEELRKVIGHLPFPGHLAILDEQHNLKPTDMAEVLVWSQENPDAHVVAKTTLGPVEVSTIFSAVALGYKHRGHCSKLPIHCSEKPLHFETMIFGSDKVGTRRYETYKQAVDGHEAVVQELLS